MLVAGLGQGGCVFANLMKMKDARYTNIFINSSLGDMKGLNTADVKIQRAKKLTLLADNTENHHWIAYSKFILQRYTKNQKKASKK